MTTILRRVTVVDGTGAPPLRDATVVLSDGRIESVTTSAVPRGDDDHDLPGHTVLPGFVDAHAHLVFTGGDDPLADVLAASDDDLAEVAARNAAAALAAGVTTVRDCGSRGLVMQRLRDDIAAGRRPGPRLLVAGPPICAPRGHLWFMGGELTGPAAEAVQRLVADGVDHIKVMASGGHMTPGSESRTAEISAADLTEIVATAHQLGVRVAAHAHATEAIERCVAAGVDTLEHCSWLAPDGFAYRPDLVDAMLAAGTVVSPTVPVYFRRDPATLSDDAGAVAEMAAIVASRRETTARMHRLGVPMVIGTDAGCRGISFGRYAEVVAVYPEAFGFTPLEAIRAATSTAADALGIGERVGRIAPGYVADVVVVDGDPSVDIGSLARVREVYQGGVARLTAARRR
jgi:imidazolonepropionase-like amidohydrolase